MRRCRGKRRRLFGAEADIGRGGSDRDWYYGCKLLLSATPEGAVAGFLLGPANTEDRWMAESFFCWRKNPLAEPFMTSKTFPPSAATASATSDRPDR